MEALYTKGSFTFPAQVDVDRIAIKAPEIIEEGNNLEITIALRQSLGRPVKNAGNRRRSWGTSKDRRLLRDLIHTLFVKV